MLKRRKQVLYADLVLAMSRQVMSVWRIVASFRASVETSNLPYLPEFVYNCCLVSAQRACQKHLQFDQRKKTEKRPRCIPEVGHIWDLIMRTKQASRAR
jgi:hypothetical protein